MKAKVILYSDKSSEINNFLNKFYSNKSDLGKSTSWKKEFPNPVEITEFIAAFADNVQSFENLYEDYGLIILPDTYSDCGPSTRLVISCHGAGGTVETDDYSFL